MNRIAIAAAKRSPIGSFGGAFKNVSAVELGKQVLKSILDETGIDPGLIDEVIIGNVLGTGLGQNVSRQIAVGAGIPHTVPAWTVNKVCASGMKAVSLAAQAVRSGEAEVIVAGGVENMSQVPYILPEFRWGGRLGDRKVIDGIVWDGLTDIFNKYHMALTAENLAEMYNITRQEMDEFALSSQQKAVEAIDNKKFAAEIVPVKVPQRKKNDLIVDTDEFPRRNTTLDGLSKLRPAFKKDGTVTAGNASGVNDGAALLLVMSEERAKTLSVKPLAYLSETASAGVDPSIMGIGPVPAIQKLLAKTKVTINEIGLFELNEAFAAQSLAVFGGLQKEGAGDIPLDKVNVNGGAIALGHPIGATGARIMVTLIHEMKKRNTAKGLASLCVGGGMGMAALLANE